MTNELTVIRRETEIIRFLKTKESGAATIREIYESVTNKIKDSVSIQAYYKIIQHMADSGKLDEVGEDPEKGKLYSVAAYLSMDFPRTLDDIYEELSLISPADAIAASIDALDYYAEKQSTTLAAAAEALKSEDPVEVFYGLIEHHVKLLKQDLDMFRDKDIRDATLETRLANQFDNLDLLFYRGLNLPTDAVDILSARNFKVTSSDIIFDADKVRAALKERIIGKTFIYEVDVSASRGDPRRSRMSVAGTDGSIHAGVLGLTTAKDFTDDYEQDFITFNNSVAYVEQAKADKNKIEYPYYCVPMTRAALENPSNRGMVLTRLMFPELSESKYEHMAKCAIDVIQLRVDSAVFQGTARSMGTGQLLPQPIVHIRDGTVTPQEREFKHYKLADSYGDMVQEGIREYRKILERIMSSKNPSVFSGAVKSTQLKVFSQALNWYIAYGSKKRFGKPIDPSWDLTRAARIADNSSMTFLLSALPNDCKSGKYWVTCGVMRQFHSLTEYYNPKRAEGLPAEFPKSGWEKFFERIYKHDIEFYNEHGGESPYFEGMSIEEDAYVYMCNNADYVTFYIGHTGGGEPPPIVPRYEFIESLRNKSHEDRISRVLRNITLVVEALDETKLSLDADHNFLTSKKIMKIIPFVTFHAHEHSKSIGRQLQTELKAIIIDRLYAIKRLRIPKGAATKILPVSIQKYVERYYNAIKEELKQDPGQFTR